MYKKNNNPRKNQKGAGALFLVLVVSAAALIIVKSVSSLGLGELELSEMANVGNKITYLSESCVEEAFRRIQLDESFSVTDKILSINGKSCIINTNREENNWTISTEASIGDYKKQITVGFEYVNGVFDINYWK